MPVRTKPRWIVGTRLMVGVIVLAAAAVFVAQSLIKSEPTALEISSTHVESARRAQEQGLKLFNQGKAKAAVAPLEKAVAGGQSDEDIRTRLALSYAAHGQLEKAEAQYQAILEEKPKNAATLYRLGVLSEQLNRPEEAVRLLEKAAATEPKSVQFGAELAKAYGLAGDRDKALAEWQRVLGLVSERDPYRATVLAHLGDIHLAKGQPEQALALYRRASTIDPANPYVKQQISRAAK